MVIGMPQDEGGPSPARWPLASADEDVEMLDRNLETFRRRLRTRVRRALRETVGEGPGRGAFAVLEGLIAEGPAAPATLAARLEVRTSTMTAHIDRLAELGWARRESAVKGSNRIQVTVTEEGRNAYERYLAIRRQALGSLVEHLPAPERRTLARLLGKAVNRGVECLLPDPSPSSPSSPSSSEEDR